MAEFDGIRLFFANLDTTGLVLLLTPFTLLLGSVAFLPLMAPHFWESNRHKAWVSLLLGTPIGLFLLYQDWHILAVTALDYGAFIALLAALFVISGGIYIRGAFSGKPITNVGFLLVGALLANVIGTTGASMLLIRPVIRANGARRQKTHIIIFFIFVVSNCAGLLTPLGDPPLFLGFLKGVPFDWTLRLWREWLFVIGALIAIFYWLDRYLLQRESAKPREPDLSEEHRDGPESFGVEGAHNFIFLAGAVGIILFSGYVLFPMEGADIFGEHPGAVLAKVVQMAGMLLLAFASYKLTPRVNHLKNRFSFHPIVEVAVVFAGIFLVMVPVQMALETRGSALEVDTQWKYFWATGLLSSFLDNAPTYLTFTSLAKGTLHEPGETLAGLAADPVGAGILAAISCGAVFMGANTYIGNGPNFMVKAIAEDSGIAMPSFMRYMSWSAAVLLPIFVLLTVLFFL